MKILNLIWLILISTLSTQGQVAYPISPTENSIKPIERQEFFSWDDNTNQWVRDYENNYEYDANYDLITKVTYLDNLSFQAYQYNNNNQLISVINANIANDGSSILNSKEAYKYDNSCLLAPDSIKNYTYNNGWQLITFQDLSNNSNCQIVTSIGGTPSFPASNQIYHFYNSTNKLIASHKLQTDIIWGLDTIESHLYTYDNNGKIETETHWGYNVFTVKYEYLRNSNGDITTTNIYYTSNQFTPPNLGVISNWSLSSRILHAYNGQGKKTMAERQSQNAAMQWETNSKIIYQYDADGDLEIKTEEFKVGNNLINYKKEHYYYVFNTNEQSISKSNFSCFPQNPYKKGTYIKCNDLVPNKNYQIKLYDVLGRLIESQKIQNDSFLLNNISEGFLYILTIEEAGEIVFHQKIIGL